MTKHTPGPWKAHALGSEGYTIVNDSHYLTIARIAGGPWEELKANAHLIAAAPDMLAALILAVEWFNGEHGDGPIGAQSLAEITQAITKASG